MFRGPLVKRMTAEQYLEGIHSLVGRDYRIWKENGSKLMEVLGRPDHRTVVLCRESKASTMQSLELLNGHAIHELIYGLHRELPKLTNNNGVQTYKPPKLEPPPLDLLNKLATQPPAELVDRLMQHALAREANAQEREVLLAMLGASPTPERVGDVVWAIINLPEFQLVR